MRYSIRPVFYLIAFLFFASGGIDLYSDNINDIGCRVGSSYDHSDNDEVFQAIAKGAFGIISIILGSKTTTKTLYKNNKKIKVLTTTRKDLHLITNLSHDSLVALYLNNLESSFKKLIVGKIDNNIRDDVIVQHILFAKENNTIITSMISEINIENKNEKYINIISKDLSRILDELMSEKIDRIEDYSRKKNVSLETAIRHVVEIQLDEMKTLFNSNTNNKNDE